MERRDNIISPWQERAMQQGRTPLPEAPGARPWVTHPETLVAAPAAYFGQVLDTGSSSGVRWDVTDIAKLLTLLQKGEEWEEIASKMNRSMTAVVSAGALWLDRLNQHVLNEDKKSEETWVEAHRRWSAVRQ
ncbi:hypothetical protein LCI18_007052 [Fusarium solani-melongenae]|uniref:Uncharacterized protein n=1 Tax=Fusarium solani subsp. cucurbitae TaxID=2747967 RepID=A0ACD3Z4M9_FUSSC|nr:hypothetical protein LCI18_007052 [Fusarium solani-melongenae]